MLSRDHVGTHTIQAQVRRHELLFWLMIAALVAVFLAMQARSMDLGSWDRDEGIALMLAQSERDGYRLFRDFFSDVSPLFVASLRIGLDILGTTLAAGRWVVLVYAALTLFVTGWLAKLIAGRWAGVAAVALLALSPGFRSSARIIWADMPSSGLATLAIALAIVYGRRRSHGWLIVAGLVMGVSLLIKPLVIVFVIPLAMAVWAGQSQEDRPHQLLLPLVELATATALPPLMALAYYGASMFNDLIAFSWQAQQAIRVDILGQLRQVGLYLSVDTGLIALAIGGILLLFRQKVRLALLVVVWIAADLGLLITRAPYWGHQTVTVLPPLAIAGSVLLSVAIHMGKLARYRKRPGAAWQSAVIACALVAWLVFLPGVIATAQIHGISTPMDSDLANLISVLKIRTGESDYVIADDLGIVFVANRHTPPELAVTSFKRLTTAYLAPEDVQRQTLRYDAAAVVLGPDRFRGGLPSYVSWVQQNCELVLQTPSGYQLYMPINWQDRFPASQRVNFAGHIDLLGYEFSPAGSDPDLSKVTLYWQAIEPTALPSTVFIHILDSTGQMVSGNDAQPMGGLYPTTEWRHGQTLRDPHQIAMPATLTSEPSYTLEIGLYDLATMQRFPARDSSGERLPDDAFRITVPKALALSLQSRVQLDKCTSPGGQTPTCRSP